MFYLYLILLTYSFFRGIRGCFRTIRSYDFVKDKKNRVTQTKTVSQFHIFIPVLREQEIIIETILHFQKLRGNYHLYIITTEKEQSDIEISENIPKKFKDLPVTRKIVEEYLKRHLPLSQKVEIIHYPHTSGAMAHQLNYALEELRSKIKDNDFILIYNADSRVKSDVLEKYKDVINSEKNCNVILQSAVFMANYQKLSIFLKSVSLLQTRWTLAHEIPRILRTQGILGITEGAHVVGHGLCLRYSYITKMGGFPENFPNEDLPLGYFIRLSGTRIHLLHQLENANSPTSIKSMFNQYRTWFYGLLFYPLYIRDALKNPKTSKPLALIWGLKYMIRGIIWLNLSLVWVLIFVLPIILNQPIWLYLSFLSFIIYAPFCFYIVYITVGKDFGIKTEVLPMLISPITYLSHSLGPWLAVYDIANSILFKSNIYKHKTER